MQATFELPDSVVHELETFAIQQGTTPDRLLQELIAEHLHRDSLRLRTRQEVRLPLITIAETGPIRAVNGSDLDDIFAREDLAS
jgi:hypothetical protein